MPGIEINEGEILVKLLEKTSALGERLDYIKDTLDKHQDDYSGVNDRLNRLETAKNRLYGAIGLLAAIMSTLVPILLEV